MSVVIRPAGAADLEAAAHIYTLARPGNPATADVLRAEDAAQTAVNAVHARWLAVLDGRVIGAAESMQPLGAAGQGQFWMELAVLESARGQGAGTQLYAALLGALLPQAPQSLKAVVSAANPAALRFAQRRGFVEVERFWDRTLDLRGAPLPDRPLPEGVQLQTLAEFAVQHPDVPAALHPLYEEARADLPRAPSERYAPLPVSALAAFLAPLDPRLVLLAVSGGKPLGFTALVPSGAPGELVIAMTGVGRAHRRQGLALALKVAAMQAAARAGWHVVRTTNHSHNTGMLAVNDALGFSQGPPRLGMLLEWATERTHTS